MRTKPFLLLVSLWLMIVILIGIATRPVHAQACSVRSDWPTYTVVRGDTLYRIARRYNATTTILATANCLTNSNRIFVGQQLRVPGAGGVPTLTPVPNTTRPITFQPFEGGYMIWWADSGDLWVLTGTQKGLLNIYPSRSYGNLPDNPVFATTPPNRIRPIMGFGRVWGNFAIVRSTLGWATGMEQSFTSTFNADPVFRNAIFTVPGGLTLFADDRSWSIHNGTPPTSAPTTQPVPQVTPTVSFQTAAASYQSFEKGFVTWRSDTGEIDVYFGKDGGYVAGFPAEYYGGMRENSIANPPLGFYSPMMGIGKVWGNIDWVRNQLGWATSFELSYTMQIRMDGQHAYKFTVPSGRQYSWVSNDSNRYWGYTALADAPASVSMSAQAIAITAVPTAQSTLVPTPNVLSIATNAAYQLYENGFMLWREDTGSVIVYPKDGEALFYSQGDYENLPDDPVTDPVPEGRIMPINGFGRVWGNFPQVRTALGWALGGEENYQTTIYQSITDQSTLANCFNLPDGRSVMQPQFVDTARTWGYVESCA